MKRLIPLLLLFFFQACSEKKPKDILSKQKMEELLTDIHLIDGYANSITPDSAKEKTPVLYQSVYKNHQTDSVQFKKSMRYYSEHPSDFQEIYDQVNKKLLQLQKAEQKRLEEKAKKERKSAKDTSANKKLKPPSDSTKTDSAKQKELQEALKRRKIMIEKIKQKMQKKK